MLEQCIAAETRDNNHSGAELEAVSSNTAMHHMQAAVLQMEHLGQNEAGGWVPHVLAQLMRPTLSVFDSAHR